MGIRLIALDLDNTLLNSALRVPERNAAAVCAARSRGIHVLLASARPPRSMRRYQEELRLTAPVVACNGALVYH
ncbi:MAG: HAD hydrolase family protein, partial [Armatimonadota bacterium]|nr:HAD hydrolase family protein [Armatimonadota bacterium]